MQDKVCMVTGANSGIGRVTALELAKMGARVILVCRNRDKGMAALADIKRQSRNEHAALLLSDFSSLSDVRRLAGDFQERHSRLDVLVNNAGLILSGRLLTPDGLETVFCVNHLAPFLLTNLLLDVLIRSGSARIINVSSDAHRYARMDFDDLQSERRYLGFQVYSNTKLANILFTLELSKRLSGTRVTSNALHPGMVATGFGRQARGLFGFTWRAIRPFLASPRRGARTSIYLAASKDVEGVTGRYFVHCRQRPPSKAARDEEAARTLWRKSAKLVGIPAFRPA